MIKFPKKKYINTYNYFKDYSKTLSKTIKKIKKKEFDIIFGIIKKTIQSKNKIFICGNGGSAAVANHFLCDFNKGVKYDNEKKYKPKIISLVSSIELVTAISNDINFNNVFESQLKTFMDKGDLLIVLSCSGNSKNLINAVNFARNNKNKVISILGFSDSKLEKLSEYKLILKCKNYGICEDIFQIIMHSVSQYLRVEDSKKIKIL